MLAWMLRGIWGLLALTAGTWWWWFRAEPPGLALAGVWAPALVYAAVLAAECAMAAVVNRDDPSPRASFMAWIRAWFRETKVSLKVFGWLQPVQAGAVADRLACMGTATTGVVFIHGFMCNRGVWTPWMKALNAEGRVFAAVTLEPVWGTIDAYAATIEEAVNRVSAATGRAPILVCHSMGGLAARAWLRAGGAGAAMRVHHIVTLGTPHHGTWLARFARAPNGRQMRRASPWLQALSAGEPRGLATRFTCLYSNCDNIVFPASTATLKGADNRLAPGVGHVELTANQQVMDFCLDLIRAS